MTDSTLNRFISSGTNAERLAFTPTPPTPASGPDVMYIWLENDTGDFYGWDPVNASWTQLNVPGIAASTTEVLTGTDSSKYVSPDALAALWEKGADEASGATLVLGEGGFFHVTGTTTITDIDFDTDKAGRHAILEFDGILTLTHNATSLILPTGANITTAAGDCCCVVSEGTDNVRVVWYQRKDGTALVGGSGSGGSPWPAFTAPVDGDYAWINQGGASVTVNANGGIYLLAPASGSDSLRVRKKAAPSTPYSITAFIMPHISNAAFLQCGLLFRQSSDGKMLSFHVLAQGNTPALQSTDWNSATSQSGTNTLSTGSTAEGLNGMDNLWLRITDNGTNRILSWSTDGYNFADLLTEGRTTFLTADEVGFFCNSINSVRISAMTLFSWEEA